MDDIVINCNQLKMISIDGKYYNTDVANTKQILRLIQSIPSKKAEPFKLWLAKVGEERIDETYDPELTIDRALETYRNKGYSEEWINQSGVSKDFYAYFNKIPKDGKFLNLGLKNCEIKQYIL